MTDYRFQTAKVMEVVCVEVCEGAGTTLDIARTVRYLYDKDGNRLATHDPWLGNVPTSVRQQAESVRQAMAADMAYMRNLLDIHQWASDGHCPECGKSADEGHTTDCRIAICIEFERAA